MRRRAGQALVEFALAISVFMLLVLGTFDLARAYFAYTVVANAAREAGRYAAVHVGEAGWDTATVQTGVKMAIGLETSNLHLTAGTNSIGTLRYVTVSGTYQFHTLTPLVRAVLGDPIPIQVDTWTLAD